MFLSTSMQMFLFHVLYKHLQVSVQFTMQWKFIHRCTLCTEQCEVCTRPSCGFILDKNSTPTMHANITYTKKNIHTTSIYLRLTATLYITVECPKLPILYTQSYLFSCLFPILITYIRIPKKYILLYFLIMGPSQSHTVYT